MKKLLKKIKKFLTKKEKIWLSMFLAFINLNHIEWEKRTIKNESEA